MLFLLFVLGACVGSFLNVCIYRLPRGESVSHPPSHCPRCNTRLKAIDLVPLVSQVVLRARCRTCQERISWRYFGIEFLTGVLFALVGASASMGASDLSNGILTGDGARLAQGLVVASALVVIFWVDYDTRLIQLEAVFLLGLAGVGLEAWRVSQGEARLTDGSFAIGPWSIGSGMLPAPLPQSIVALVAVAGGLWLMRTGFSELYGKEALGFGDVMLAGGIAANLGWNATIFTFFFLSVVLGASIGVTMRIPHAIRAYRWGKTRAQRYGTPSLARPLARHAFRKAIPFGPMLAIGAIVAMLYGPQLNQSYLNWLAPPDPTSRPTFAPPLP